MDDEISLQLEQIGLNKSEVKVYLTLLRIGASSTGPIITQSKTANSKIYEVLDKLIEKGLVSHFVKENTRYFKAASPKMLLEFLDQRKNEIDSEKEKINKIIPNLMSYSGKDEENEATIFSGHRGVKTAFMDLVDELDAGEEVHIMGVYDFGKVFMRQSIFFQKLRSKKKINAKFLINDDARSVAEEFKRYKPVEIRFLPKGMFTPAIFLIYSDKVVVNIAKEMTFFVLKSKSAKDAFEAYFQLLWKAAAPK